MRAMGVRGEKTYGCKPAYHQATRRKHKKNSSELSLK